MIKCNRCTPKGRGEMNDRKMKNILVAAICLFLAVAGALYQISTNQDAKTIKEYFQVVE